MHLSLLILNSFIGVTFSQTQCVKKTPCSCEMSDGSGIIDISSLGQANTPRFDHVSAQLPGDDYLYSYNPCVSFTDGNCVDTVACQYPRDNKTQYPLARLSNTTFSYNGSYVSTIQKYTDELGSLRTFEVTLLCDLDALSPSFTMIGEVSELQYTGTLRSKCACLNGCSNEPPPAQKGCVRKNQCQCEMADGSGMIDLTKIGSEDLKPRFRDVIAPDGFFYSYNPCYPFIQGTCHGAAVCQLSGDLETTYLVGNSSTAVFETGEDGKVRVVYTAEDQQGLNRTAVVDLICDRETTQSSLAALGEVEPRTYYFNLTSPKVCPQKENEMKDLLMMLQNISL